MRELEFIEVPQPFEKRLEIAKKKLSGGEPSVLDPNCFSTGLFLFGVIPYDIAVFPIGKDKSNVNEVIPFLEELEEPKDNCLIISRDIEDEIIHFSFLREANPLRGYQRKGLGESLSKFTSTKGIDRYLKKIHDSSFDHKYYSKGNNQKELREYSQEIVSRYNSILDSDIALDEMLDRLKAKKHTPNSQNHS